MSTNELLKLSEECLKILRVPDPCKQPKYNIYLESLRPTAKNRWLHGWDSYLLNLWNLHPSPTM